VIQKINNRRCSGLLSFSGTRSLISGMWVARPKSRSRSCTRFAIASRSGCRPYLCILSKEEAA